MTSICKSSLDGTTASGPIYNETVTVGGLEAIQQAVGAANLSTLMNNGADVISGMAFPSIAQFKRDPFFFTLLKQKAVAKGIFAFGLSRNNARLDLGGLDSGSYTGQIAYSKVDNSGGFWQTHGQLNGLNIKAIIDTGTSVVIGPPLAVAAACIAAGGQVTADLSLEVLCLYDANKVPKFTFSEFVPPVLRLRLHNKKHMTDPDSFTPHQPAFGSGSYTLSNDSLAFTTMNGKIVAGVIGSTIGIEDGWIVGDTFLQNVYAAFVSCSLMSSCSICLNHRSLTVFVRSLFSLVTFTFTFAGCR